MHFTQEQLAEFAEISFSYMADIEYSRTWVSDKTLAKIARALGTDPYRLLIPAEEAPERERNESPLYGISELINEKKLELKNAADSAMTDLMHSIAGRYGGINP